MKRVFILLFDSFGIGAADDAASFGDQGADTFGHIAQWCAQGKANIANSKRHGVLQIPNLAKLGLIAAAQQSTNKTIAGYENYNGSLSGAYGHAQEKSLGKDTPSGHWEIAGVPVLFEWGYFPPEYPSFPEKLLTELITRGELPGVLGNKHASGTQIIADLGEEHIQSGKPIVYTSADSVFQIAAHEEHFGLQRLYDLCNIARELVDEYNIGRVIARPFLGKAGNFYRTANRRDLATPPPQPTLLDYLKQAHHDVISIGKVADIYAHQGITQKFKGDGNMALFDATLQVQQDAPDGSLVFTNFVDFDSVYGHRRNVAGYAQALEELDSRLPEFIKNMQDGDIAFITADHGCDPTWPGSDHTREHIPVLLFGPSIKSQNLGARTSFADIGQSIASYFGLEPLASGTSFINTENVTHG